MKSIILLTLLLGCGKLKVETKSSTQYVEATINIGYEEVARFCDERYGEKTIEAEDCFLDYRNFLDTSISFDTDNLLDFCKGFEEPNKCLADLTNLTNIPNKAGKK